MNKELVVLLHNIRSLYNVGSVFRTADAAGVSKIYLCGITPAPVDILGKPRQKLAKVSLGAENYVPWEKQKNISRTIETLKNAGYKILALEQSRKSIKYHESSVKKYKKIALIIGNEVKGLPPAILKKCDKILEIPMRGSKESLNVSVAFGIAVFELIKK